MNKDSIIFLSETERQLILYKYLGSPCIKERHDVLSLYQIPSSTIYKDMRDLTDAGLINLKYDAKYDEYVENDKEHNYDPTKDKPTRVRHLRRLCRLAICMKQLYNDPPEINWDEDVHYIEKGEKTCKDYYMEFFRQNQ